MPVHPQVAQYLEEISKVDLPPFEEMTPEFIRSTLTPSPEPHIPSQSIENRSIPVNGTKIPIRIYTPPEAIMINAEEMPALVFFHGGGWVMGTLDAYDGVCQDLAGTSGCKVISVDYRMAPEFPYPPVNSALIVIRLQSAVIARGETLLLQLLSKQGIQNL